MGALRQPFSRDQGIKSEIALKCRVISPWRRWRDVSVTAAKQICRKQDLGWCPVRMVSSTSNRSPHKFCRSGKLESRLDIRTDDRAVETAAWCCCRKSCVPWVVLVPSTCAQSAGLGHFLLFWLSEACCRVFALIVLEMQWLSERQIKLQCEEWVNIKS